MSVESGLGAPAERVAAGPSASGGERARARPGVRARGRGPARTEALADAVSTSPGSGGRPRPQARRVRRVVRRIELWSVLKVSLVFNTVMLGIALGTVAILWGLANTTGVVQDLEGFLRDSGFEDFRFQGDRMFRQVAFIGAVGTLAFTVFTVLATALVNLISEVTGGIRLIVLEEIVEGEPATPSAGQPAAPATGADRDRSDTPRAPSRGPVSAWAIDRLGRVGRPPEMGPGSEDGPRPPGPARAEDPSSGPHPPAP